MSAAKTGTPAELSCSASSWSVLVLPVPVAPGDEAVPVDHGQRDPDVDVGERGRVEHQAAELEGGPLEGVARRHGRRDRVERRLGRLGWRGLGRRHRRNGRPRAATGGTGSTGGAGGSAGSAGGGVVSLMGAA